MMQGVRLEKWINEIIAAVVVSFFATIMWFVRTVLTNASRIDLLEKEMAERDKRRIEDREFISEMRREIRDELKDLRAEIHRVALKD
jgi:hypothetical protein